MMLCCERKLFTSSVRDCGIRFRRTSYAVLVLPVSVFPSSPSPTQTLTNSHRYEPMFCAATAFLGSFCIVVGLNLVYFCVKNEYFAPNFLPGKMIDDPNNPVDATMAPALTGTGTSALWVGGPKKKLVEVTMEAA